MWSSGAVNLHEVRIWSARLQLRQLTEVRVVEGVLKIVFWQVHQVGRRVLEPMQGNNFENKVRVKRNLMKINFNVPVLNMVSMKTRVYKYLLIVTTHIYFLTLLEYSSLDI